MYSWLYEDVCRLSPGEVRCTVLFDILICAPAWLVEFYFFKYLYAVRERDAMFRQNEEWRGFCLRSGRCFLSPNYLYTFQQKKGRFPWDVSRDENVLLASTKFTTVLPIYRQTDNSLGALQNGSFPSPGGAIHTTLIAGVSALRFLPTGFVIGCGPLFSKQEAETDLQAGNLHLFRWFLLLNISFFYVTFPNVSKKAEHHSWTFVFQRLHTVNELLFQSVSSIVATTSEKSDLHMKNRG